MNFKSLKLEKLDFVVFAKKLLNNFEVQNKVEQETQLFRVDTYLPNIRRDKQLIR